MKKLLAALIALMILMCSCAFAEGQFIGDMQVINCREWVSLRSEPSTESERITKIPVDSIVEECYAYDEAWVYGMFCGMYGYVSTDYLTPVGDNLSDGVMLYEERNGITVVGSYGYADNGEYYNIGAYNENGSIIWSYDAMCSYTTELQLVDAFIAGTEEKPLVMAYSAEYGLTALDFFTGEPVWTITDEEFSLGGGICYCVDEYGMIYIGGYYGPDPAAITPDGEVLWASNLGGRYYWLYKIEMDEDRNLVCYYEMNDETYESAIVTMPTKPS